MSRRYGWPMLTLLPLTALTCRPAETHRHVWEKHEITLTARNSYKNPYTEVEVWVDLKGPSFAKRVYGFWDGGNTFRVRVLATHPGRWTWRSGSTPSDAGLKDKRGSFEASDWTDAEKAADLCRRGFLRPTANRHALEHADGTPFFLLGDTWWATPTSRFRWFDDDASRPFGPEAGFRDYVKFRKAQQFNSVAMLAAFPAWANDGKPPNLFLNDPEKTVVRSAWRQPGTSSAKDMVNAGGRPFLFPGRVPGFEDVFPDVDRINPAYFQHLDKKIDYLNAQGFIPFIEVARRDVSQAWKKFYAWPESYARYIQYVWSRYQANNCIFSPIHFDTRSSSIPARDYHAPINLVMKKYGAPPFGTLVSTNAALSTLANFGESEEARWLTLHQLGNFREHEFYWYLTEIFHAARTLPALNGEPYYAGYTAARQGKAAVEAGSGAPGGSESDDRYCRSAMYGSVLSGGLAGHIYGAEGIWAADIEPAASPKMWESFQWKSGAQMQHLGTFVFSEGRRFQDLVPDSNLVSPSRTHHTRGFDGWAYCARTREKDFFLVYFEKGCPQSRIRGALPERKYAARWFDPRTGEWSPAGPGTLSADPNGVIPLPNLPREDDWGLSLVLR